MGPRARAGVGESEGEGWVGVGRRGAWLGSGVELGLEIGCEGGGEGEGEGWVGVGVLRGSRRHDSAY